jgi:lysophospholipid acyltransferase (LPLAT)-like uncharacterized protein
VTLSRSKRLQAEAIAVVGMPIVEAVNATYEWRAEGGEAVDAIVRQGRQPIYSFWHGRSLLAMLHFRDRAIVPIISQNFDGEWVTRLMRKFGYGAARGSTSRGGGRALVQLRRDLLAGSAVAFTLDGPRGPSRVAQQGAAFLAGATGYPMLPFHIESSSCWTLGSWDSQQVPKPGAVVAVAIGKPIEVASTEDAAVEAGRQDVERALAALEVRSKAMLR